MAIPVLSPTVPSQLGPVVTSIMANTQMNMSLSSNTFSFPLQNVFDKIAHRELPHIMPVIELDSPVEHVDMHFARA